MRILLVRLRPLGDVVFTTPLLGALRRRYPEAHLTYVVEPGPAPVLHGNPHVDALIVVPRRRGLLRVGDDARVARELARGRYDIAIDLHGGPRSALFTWASRAPRRIGYAIPGRRWMYTDVVARARDLAPRHSVANQWDLLSPLGVPLGTPATDPVWMAEDAAARARVAQRLRESRIEPAHAVVMMHVGASNHFKRWPEASFVTLITSLVERGSERRIVLVPGPAEADGARRVGEDARRRLGGRGDRVVTMPDLAIPDLRALAAGAAVYVGGDSGPLHVAATTAVPIVELLGPTLPERSRPWRDPRWFSETIDAGPLPCRPCHQIVCEPADFRCLTSIGPERVLGAVERALAASGREAEPGPTAANARRIAGTPA